MNKETVKQLNESPIFAIYVLYKGLKEKYDTTNHIGEKFDLDFDEVLFHIDKAMEKLLILINKK